MISIGIHIQDHHIAVVKLLLKNGKIETKEITKYSLGHRLTDEERRVKIAEHLNQIFEKQQKEPCRFCFTLPQNQVSSFQASFPFKERFKILRTIPFEIEDKSPFRLDKILFDIRFSNITKKNQSDVICFLTPKQHVTDFLDFVKKTKISPYLLSAEAAAISNLIEGLNQPSERTTKSKKGSLYIHLGYTESFALFFYNKQLRHISTFSWGFDSVVENMMSRYQLSFEEAQNQFAEKAFVLTEKKGVTKEQVFFSQLIKAELHLLVDKLKILKLSLETDKEIQIQEGFILGTGSVIQNLSSFLSEELSLPVQRMKKITKFSDWNLFDPTSHSFLVPLGLALEGFKRPPYEGLNLIRSLNKKMGLFFLQDKWKKPILYVVAGFFLLTSYSFFRKQQNEKISDQVHNIFMNYGKKVAFLSARNTTVEDVENFLNTQESIKTNRIFVQDQVSEPQPIDRLKILTKHINTKPEWNFKLTFLKIEGRKIHMEGYVAEDFSVDFKNQLQEISENKKVDTLTPKIKKEDSKVENLKLDLKKEDSKVENLKLDLKKEEEEEEEEEEVPQEEDKDLNFAYSFNLKDDL